MKECKECGECKHLSEFYSNDGMTDGCLNQCKVCVRIRVNKHRYNNIDAMRRYDLDREKAGRVRKIRAKYPMKNAARAAINSRIHSGSIIRPTVCESCGFIGKIQAHHWSYLKEHWLDVEWLCTKCHAKGHIQLRAIGMEPKEP